MTPRAAAASAKQDTGARSTPAPICRLREISDQLRALREVRYVGISAGRYDIMVEAFFVDQQHFLEFISGTVGRMEGVSGIETSMIWGGQVLVRVGDHLTSGVHPRRGDPP